VISVRDGRNLAVYERSEVIFSDPSRDVAVAANYGKRLKVPLLRWTQAYQLTHLSTIIHRRRGGIAGWGTARLCLASSFLCLNADSGR